MILFNRKAVNQAVNINGQVVKFVACKAEVDDKFGEEILKMGFPDIFEFGKQPEFETPKEVRIKSEFKDREEWYKRELTKLKATIDNYKEKLKVAEADVQLWKNEYAKEHELRIQLIEASKALPEANVPQAENNLENEAKPEKEAEVPAESAGEATDEAPKAEGVDFEIESLREELSALKKDELIKFGEESGLDMSSVQGLTKKEIVEYILSEK